MKKTFTLILIWISVMYGYGQTEVQISTGAQYVDDVYYSLENGILKTSARAGWDIAFAAKQMSVSVLANNGNGVMLYTYPDGTIDDWTSVDTTGMTWKPLFNSIEDWEYGAFNANTVEDNVFDYGWGVYNISNHFITGDSLFIIGLADGRFKKLAIVEKDAINNRYTFKYADIDGSNEVTETFDADDYETTFIHYSIANGEFVEHEPVERWQLLFTRYWDYDVPYFVAGVLANSGVKIQEVKGVDQAGYADYDLSLFTDTLSQIGWDWKIFNMQTFEYEVAGDVVFFIRDTLDGEEPYDVWKIYFTAFGGSADGVYSLIQEKLDQTPTGIDNAGISHNVSVYPNPAGAYAKIMHDLKGDISIKVYNIAGKLVLNRLVNGNSEPGILTLDVGALSPGSYSIVVQSGAERHILKLMKR